jgi:fructose-1,6-bisphosphatase/inositol monophosphatase family enzyme
LQVIHYFIKKKGSGFLLNKKIEHEEISELSKIRMKYLHILENVAKNVAKKIDDYGGKVYDTLHKRGHEESILDIKAYEWMTGSLEEEMRILKDSEKFKGQFLYELREVQDVEKKKGDNLVKGVMIIDEIDGTTNTKRAKASLFKYGPRACVSVSLGDSTDLGSILVGVVHDLHNNNTFSGVRFLENIPKSFIAFCDGMRLNPYDFFEKKGDECNRIMVVGYSNTERIKKAKIEEAIIGIDGKKKEYRVYDGSRSSANDILNIIKNQYDAYVDPRALWQDSGAMLEPYDVAGIIPIAYGCGLEVCDIFGEPIEDYVQGKPLTLIIARNNELKNKIVNSLKPLLKEPDFITKA